MDGVIASMLIIPQAHDQHRGAHFALMGTIWYRTGMVLL